MIKKIISWFMPGSEYIAEEEEAVMEEPQPVKYSKQTSKDMQQRNILTVDVVTVNEDVEEEEALRDLQAAMVDVVFYNHSDIKHQVWAKFPANSSNRFSYRDNLKRRSLEPMISPVNKKYRDRTHVFPIGYHGSESDFRLLVGWDSQQNRTVINQFERRVAKYNQTNEILWFVDIERQADGSAIWSSHVWNSRGEKIFERSWHDRKKYLWR